MFRFQQFIRVKSAFRRKGLACVDGGGPSVTLRLASIAVALGMLAVARPAYADDLPKTAEVSSSGKLSILNTMGYAPMGYYEEGKKPAGLVVELAQAAADALGVKLEIIPTPFASIFPSIAAGRAKISWSTYTATPERLKVADFVTFIKSGVVLIVPTGKLSDFQTWDKLCGAKIALYKGNTGDFAADKLNEECEKVGKPKIVKLLFPTQTETIQAVLAGRAEGRLDDTTAALYYITTTNNTMAIAPGEYIPLPLGAIVQKGDAQTAQMLQKVIQHLMDNGTYAKILDKYNMGSAAIDRSEIITSVEQLPK